MTVRCSTAVWGPGGIDVEFEYVAVPRVGEIVELPDGVAARVERVAHFPQTDEFNGPYVRLFLRRESDANRT